MYLYTYQLASWFLSTHAPTGTVRGHFENNRIMHLEIKLVTIWKFIILGVIISMTFLFSMITLMHGKPEWICVLLTFPIIIGSMYLSALLSNQRKFIEIENGILTVNKRNPIQIDQIEWYNQESNILLEGIRIKTKQHKNHFFSTINFSKKDPNFKIFKEILINKSLDHQLFEKTTQQLYHENKLLKYGSTVAMTLFLLFFLLTLITDLKFDKVKLFYIGAIIIGTFISTRK